MRNFLFSSLFLGLFLLNACSSGSSDETTTESDSTQTSTSSSESTPTPSDAGNYMELDTDMALSDYVGQKIWIEGTIANASDVHEHMMKGASPFGDAEKYVFINYNNGEQTTGYYTTITVAEDAQTHKFYGSVDKISGAGKGGENHTEYYLNLEKVE